MFQKLVWKLIQSLYINKKINAEGKNDILSAPLPAPLRLCVKIFSTSRKKLPMSIHHFILLLLLIFPFQTGAEETPASLTSLDKIIPRAEITDADCLECHGVAGYSVPTGAHGEGPKRRLDINAEGLQNSVHGKLNCLNCHADIEQIPHTKDGLQAVDCVDCHLSLNAGAAPVRKSWLSQPEGMEIVINTKRYTHSIHADASKENNAQCADCHTAHYVYPKENPQSSVYRLNSPEMCGTCHHQALEEYRRSIHGAALKRPWQGDSATCADCHSSHQISEKEEVDAHRVVTEQCSTCHVRETKSYMATTHGQLAWLGYQEVARCADCHRPHDTHKVTDTDAKISADNILTTCRECHKNAQASFTLFRAHADLNDYQRNPELWWLGRIMVGIVIGVLIFFYTHSMLWFIRELKSRPVSWVTVDGKSYPVRAKRVKHCSDQHFCRFSWYWRANHWALALSVMVLVFTGMSVMYPNTSWAMNAIWFVGGWEVFGLIHRIAAVIFLLAVFGHAAVVLWQVLRSPNFRWFGPDSLLPRWQDAIDMYHQFRWFFGQGEAPRFDRWTYWEKFDYWAVYWGAFVIGLSGLILWFSDSLSAILPGWVFNLAILAHSVEAFLAVTTLFVVHFFNNHFRPSKFPLDTVMFIGSWDLEEFKEERPAHYERLKASGELERLLVDPPSPTANLISHILGFTLLGIGLCLLVLVIIGFAGRGLV